MDVPLDELGRRQAVALGQASALRDASRVVSSPLARARETAAALGPPVTVDERWTEVDYGIYDGLEVGAVPELFRQWSRDIRYVPEGGESLGAVGTRVREACEDLWPEAAERDIVVVTHVSPIKAAVAWTLGVGDETSWRMFVDVASVTCVGPGRSRPGLRAGAAGSGAAEPVAGAAGSGASGAELPGPTLRTFNETQHRPST
jgi:broad specificity phosphatase PhoE